MDTQTFVQQAKDYESYCAAQVDAQFGKPAKYLTAMGAGPYYAIIAEENNLCSWGGLLTNTDYQVFDYNRLPIKGLYAVGNEAGSNLFNDTYVGFGYGMANTITSGYICGGKLGDMLKK
jgi:fumarate reductase flavoprotein subunit